MAADVMYFYDALDADTLYLTGDTDNLKLGEGGFTPATFGVDGGAETIDVFCAHTDDTVEAAFDALVKWLARARDRYESGRPRIYLYWEPGTGRTYHRRAAVRSGHVVKRSWASGADRAAQNIWFQITVDHECAEQDEAITLKNLVQNPSFEYDTNADGLADNWSDLGTGAPAFTMATAVSTHGRLAQRVDHDGAAASEGIKSANIAVVTGTAYEYKVDVYHTGSGSAQTCEIELRLTADDSSLDNASSSVAESTWTTVRGTWTSTVTGNIYIDLHNDGNDASLRTRWDKVYLGVQNTYDGSDYDHGMWSDYYVVDNHEDWAWDNTAGAPEGCDEQNSTDRQIVDVTGCLGNVAPGLKVQIQPLTNYQHAVVSLLSHPEADKTFLCLQAEDASLTNASTATVNGASGAGANNCIDMNVAAAIAKHATWYIDEANFLKLQGKRVRVYIVAMPKVGADYDMTWGIGAQDHAQAYAATTPPEEFTAGLSNGKWGLFAGPEFYFPPVPSKSPRDGIVAGLYLIFYAEQAAGNDVYLDRLFLVPTDGFLETEVDGTAVGGAPVQFCNDGVFLFYDGGTDDQEIIYHEIAAVGQLDQYPLEDVLRLWIWMHDDTWSGAGSDDENSYVTIVYRPRFATL
jgi:hypothetical protein